MSDRKDADEREDADVEAPAASASDAKKNVAERAAQPADDDDDDDDDEEEEADERRSEAPAEAKRAVAGGSQARNRSRKSARKASIPPPVSAASRIVPFAVLALLVGAAGGWFGHDAQAKAKIKAESAAAPVGSGAPAGPCGAWQTKICTSAGDKSEACRQAKGAVELLTPGSCETAMSVLPATLTKLKAARAGCDKLMNKLCADLQPGSQGCKLVQEQTPSFPSKRCDELMEHYDEVIGELRRMDQQAPPGMGAPGMGAPPMAPPGGDAPPGAAPH